MRPAAILIVLVMFTQQALAQRSQSRPTSQPMTQPTHVAGVKVSDKLSITDHELKLPSGVLKYKATAGYMTVKDEAGKEKANFFFVAYEKTLPDGTDKSDRPMTYVFNGGPGAAAVWLHLGTAGPKRVQLMEEGHAPQPPYRWVDNQHTWLDATDLVFIDPIGTGYSRPAAGERGEQFFGVREDVSSVADFIRLYTTKYERWLSPKFLAGESYGTTRAAALSQHLVDRYGISLNGIVLVSTVLDFQTIAFGDGNDLPYALFLPTYAATAHYHKKLPSDLQQMEMEKVLAEVEQFASNEYTLALARGVALPADQRKAVAEKLSRYTGLTVEHVEKSNLRIRADNFRKMLLGDSRQLVGRFDSRIKGYDPRPVAASPDYDPSLPEYLAVYSAAFNDYVRRSLKYENDLPYEVLSGLVQPWNYGRGNSGYLNVAEDLRTAMMKTPHLKVMFASGYFDLATPYFTTNYTVDHMDLGHQLRSNVSIRYYIGGHMMYHHQKTLKQLRDDIGVFFDSALPKK
jgi:carboxypeptidase C (cathepsin A)